MTSFIVRKAFALLVVLGVVATASAAPPTTPPAKPVNPGLYEPELTYVPPPPKGSPFAPSAPAAPALVWPSKPLVLTPSIGSTVLAPPVEGQFKLTDKGFVWVPAITAGVKGGFDYSKFPDERKKLIDSVSYPNLGSDFEVVAPSTGHPNSEVIPAGKTYNCIAWSLGITDRWVWPGETMAAFDKLYGEHGYKRLTVRDATLKVGVEKIMLYGKHKAVKFKWADGTTREEAVFVATHAARQEADGTWSSKLGGLARIKHPTPESVSGTTYGDPIAVYVRKKTP